MSKNTRYRKAEEKANDFNREIVPPSMQHNPIFVDVGRMFQRMFSRS